MHAMAMRPAPGRLRTPLRPGLAALAVAVVAVVAGASSASGATRPSTTAPATLPSPCVGDLAVVTCTFRYDGTTGADGEAQAFTVPKAVSRLTIEAWGAQGGTATTVGEPVLATGRGRPGRLHPGDGAGIRR